MKYFLELAYKGKNYKGWQIQPNVISVQEELEKGMTTILRKKVTVVAAGRTDAGVHASQMFVHFETEDKLADNFTYKLNRILPDDIVVYKTFLVADEAHARFDAISRSYEYNIWLGINPFLLDTTWQLHYKKLDIALMNKAAHILYDYEDFECFSKVKTDVFTFNCTITNAEWVLEGDKLVFHISANRFLRNMVRAIVGTLLEVGLHKITLQDFKNIIESKNRSKAGVSVPAKGLFLTKVEYDFIKQ